MRAFILSVVLACATVPALAQTPEPETPPPNPPPEKSAFLERVYVGGGVGAGFGTIDYFTIAPMVGFHVVKHLDLGFQPFYRWTRDGRYSPSVTTNDYGAGIFARVPIKWGLFAEADYEHTSFEYPVVGGTARDTHDAFLAGGGYSFPVGGHVGLYASALYDFNYDDNDPYGQFYDSPVRFQIGVAVGF